MIRYAFDESGGLIVCSGDGNWSYAYPTSPHAVMASRKGKAGIIAKGMASQADANALRLPAEIITKHNAHLRAAFLRAFDPKSAREIEQKHPVN